LSSALNLRRCVMLDIAAGDIEVYSVGRIISLSPHARIDKYSFTHRLALSIH
jgi:hypothetical protein